MLQTVLMLCIQYVCEVLVQYFSVFLLYIIFNLAPYLLLYSYPHCTERKHNTGRKEARSPAAAPVCAGRGSVHFRAPGPSGGARASLGFIRGPSPNPNGMSASDQAADLGGAVRERATTILRAGPSRRRPWRLIPAHAPGSGEIRTPHAYMNSWFL